MRKNDLKEADVTLAQKNMPKTAWITGASSGIGRQLALDLAQEGWNVIASARNEAALNLLATENPDRIHAFPLDVTIRADVGRAVDAIEQIYGPISLAIFAAGTYKRNTGFEFDASVFEDMVRLNIMGTVYCLEAILLKMRERHAGHIAVTSSVSGYTGLPGASAYGATKAALINMCEALYPELEVQNIKLTLINPGFVDTPLSRKNDFPMPFLISAKQASQIIIKGLKKGRYEIIFPWKMALAIKLLHAMPAWLRFMLTRRMVQR